MTGLILEVDSTYLHAVNGKARPCIKLLVADVTFEVLCFLVLNQNLFIIKLTIAIPINQLRKNSKHCLLYHLHTKHSSLLARVIVPLQLQTEFLFSSF